MRKGDFVVVGVVVLVVGTVGEVCGSILDGCGCVSGADNEPSVSVGMFGAWGSGECGSRRRGSMCDSLGCRVELGDARRFGVGAVVLIEKLHDGCS